MICLKLPINRHYVYFLSSDFAFIFRSKRLDLCSNWHAKNEILNYTYRDREREYSVSVFHGTAMALLQKVTKNLNQNAKTCDQNAIFRGQKRANFSVSLFSASCIDELHD
jgi:hypothetical protein